MSAFPFSFTSLRACSNAVIHSQTKTSGISLVCLLFRILFNNSFDNISYTPLCLNFCIKKESLLLRFTSNLRLIYLKKNTIQKHLLSLVFLMVSKKLAWLAKSMCHKPSVYAAFSDFGKSSNPPLATKKACIYACFKAFCRQWLATWLATLLTFFIAMQKQRVFRLLLSPHY